MMLSQFRKTTVILLVIFSTLFGASFSIFPAIQERSLTKPLISLPFSKIKKYYNPTQCLELCAGWIECADVTQKKEEPPENLYPTDWKYVDIPTHPFSLPFPKEHITRTGYLKPTIDVYSWGDENDVLKDDVYFGLFFDAPCDPYYIECRSSTTVPSENKKMQEVIREFIKPSENLLIRQIRRTLPDGQTRIFFTVFHNGEQTNLQYYPDQDYRNVDLAWEVLKFIQTRPLSDAQSEKEFSQLSIKLSHTSAPIPDAWSYQHIQDLPFDLRLPDQKRETKYQLKNPYKYWLEEHSSLSESVHEQYDVYFTALPDSNFNGPIAHIVITPFREWNNADLLKAICPSIEKNEGETVDGIQVLQIESGCQLDGTHLYHYQDIYYLLKVEEGNTPNLNSVLLEPQRRIDEEKRRIYTTMIGQNSLSLSYDPEITNDPFRSNVLTLSLESRTPQQGSILIHFLPIIPKDIPEVLDNPLFQMGKEIRSAIMKKDPCSLEIPETLLIANCEWINTGKYGGMRFMVAKEADAMGKKYEVLGSAYMIFTDSTTWPAITFVLQRNDLPREMRFVDSAEEMEEVMKNIETGYTQNLLKREIDHIISTLIIDSKERK